MPTIEVTVESKLHRSFRVEQLLGMFDLKPEKKLCERFRGEIPATDEAWQIGAIVGPSGSGKTTLARRAFGENLVRDHAWPADAAVIDGFGDRRVQEITKILSAVGFSSPPSWLKPYAVLSNGEQFRANLARALLAGRPLTAYDEFTSVVDRTVARIGSAAVSKAVRREQGMGKFVAITCHYDVLEWLEPDWVLDMASGTLARGRLRRPEIRLEIAPVHRSAWVLFRRHHYLSGTLSNSAHCFVAFWGDTPVAFSAWINVGAVGRGDKTSCLNRREHRTVVLPDFQGVGIGNRLSEFCASIWKGIGLRALSTTSHPAIIHYRSRSPHWKRRRLGFVSSHLRPVERKYGRYNSAARLTGAFEYVGPALPRIDAERFLQSKSAPFAPRDMSERILDVLNHYPGCPIGYLARAIGHSTTGVRGALAELQELGLVTRAGKGGAGARQFAWYAAVRGN